MRTALVTTCVNEYQKNISQYTISNMKDYAKRIGTEFVCIDKADISQDHPELEKFKIFNLLNQFDRIIYFEIGVLIRDDCPNLFDMIPYDHFGAFNDGAFIDHSKDMKIITEKFRAEITDWNRQYLNTNVMIISRCHKFLFDMPPIDVIDLDISALLNFRIIRNKTKVKPLTYQYNRMPFVDELTGEHRLASYIVNYTNVNPQAKEIALKKDSEEWGKVSPNYNYKRNIIVKVHGGLGDEVGAEPVIRYMAEKVYPDANIVVATWFPRLFSHLPVKVIHIKDGKLPEVNTPYYVMNTLLPPEDPIWKYSTPNLMYTTDFISQMCLRCILPDNKKDIKLDVYPEDMEEIHGVIGDINPKDLILIHPGKGWASKTFPDTYWYSIVEALIKNGNKVAIIGKYISNEQGTTGMKVPDGVIDTRDILSLGGLIAIISQAKILVSNDSAPVHIAGAFDNHILLIPTCKHPDHVLPLRNGSRKYKTRSLYKKLLCDFIDMAPTQVHGQTIDYVVGDIMDYLPDPSDIVKCVNEI